MEPQDNNFNYKIILAALAAVIIGILIAFYYSNAQSNNEIINLEFEKSELVEDMTFLQAEVDKLKARNESDILTIAQLTDFNQQLEDSIGQLNFDITKQRRYRKELRNLEALYDSVRIKNKDLLYTNEVQRRQLISVKKEIEKMKKINRAYAKREDQFIKEQRQRLDKLAKKVYLVVEQPEGNGVALRSGRIMNTDKASVVSKLKGSLVIIGNTTQAGTSKVIYFQFLDPNKRVIADNANIINLNGNEYSKKVEFIASSNDTRKEGSITVPTGSLESGVYTVNVFEDEKLLSSVEFTLK